MLWRAHAPAVLPPPPEFWAADLLLNCSGAARQQLVDNARWAATLKQRAVELKLAPSTKSWLPLGRDARAHGMEQLVAPRQPHLRASAVDVAARWTAPPASSGG